MTPFRRLAAPLVAVLLAATAAHAQSGPGGGPDLQRLHDALRLTPDQEGAWSVFAAASATDPEQLARERAAQQMMPRLTSPQRVALSIAAAEADLATLRRRGEALRAFYATLSPVKQAEFDRQTTPNDQDQGD